MIQSLFFLFLTILQTILTMLTMQSRPLIRYVGFTVFIIAAAISSASATSTNLVERHFQKHWWESRKPGKPTPENQLNYANQLRESGSLRKASNQYRALVYTWPESPEAPIAQFNFAGCLYERNNLLSAFDEYQFLLDIYSGFAPYDEVINRQYAIADAIATRKRYFLFFPYTSPENAIPLFERLIKNAPRWPKASELQFRIGRIYEKTKQYDMAIEAYQAYQHLYPKGSLAEQACFSRATCFHRMAKKNSVSTDMRDNARSAFQYFLNRYPKSEMADPARTYLKELQLIQATDYYQQARAYERSARRVYNKKQGVQQLTAAKMIYRRLINEFSGSRWDDMARSRIKQINTKLEKYRE